MLEASLVHWIIELMLWAWSNLLLVLLLFGVGQLVWHSLQKAKADDE